MPHILDEVEDIIAIDDVDRFIAHPFYTNIPACKWRVSNVKHGDDILFKLIERDCPKCLDAMLRQCAQIEPSYANQGYTPLGYAFNMERVECVKVLMAQTSNGLIHVDLDQVTGNDPVLAPLVVAIACKNADRALEFVTLLVEHRPPINLNVTNRNCQWDSLHSPLACAVILNRSDIVRLLLSTGDRVNIDSANLEGLTALHVAANKGITDIVIQLLRAGADRTVKNKAGQTPSQFACRADIKELIDNFRPAIVSSEVAHKVDDELLNALHLVDPSTALNLPDLNARLDGQLNKNPNTVMVDGNTPIQIALAEKCSIKIIRDMLVDDLDLSVRSSDGRTAIDMATGATKDMLIEFANRQRLKKNMNTEGKIKTEKSNKEEDIDVQQLSTLSINKASSDVIKPVEERFVEKPAEHVATPKKMMTADSRSASPRSCRQCQSDSVEVNIVLLPCNHVCMCEECSEEARKNNRFKCPNCKQIVRQYMRVRF